MTNHLKNFFSMTYMISFFAYIFSGQRVFHQNPHLLASIPMQVFPQMLVFHNYTSFANYDVQSHHISITIKPACFQYFLDLTFLHPLIVKVVFSTFFNWTVKNNSKLVYNIDICSVRDS